MRALVLSDIHENIDSVRQLREREDNAYDAIFVAGDIGNEIAETFYGVFDTFDCPVFCVYGNWDYDLPYKRKLSNNCVLLHHRIERVNGFFVTGFSGCPTSWGRNPIHLAKKKALLDKHRVVLSRLARAEKSVERQTQEIIAEHATVLDSLARSAKDRRKKSYKKRVRKIEERMQQEITSTRVTIDRVYETSAYGAYKNDYLAIADDTLRSNRNSLLDLVKKQKLPQDKLIIVTHERMFKIWQDGVTPLLHIFGHIHKYAFSLFKGTHYLNAAAMDNGYSAFFGRKILLPEGYCDVQILRGVVTVTRKELDHNQRASGRLIIRPSGRSPAAGAA